MGLAAGERSGWRRWALALAAVLCSATSAGAAGTSRDVAEGRVLFGRYCAACHGLAADGRGPVAGVLLQAPSDLRRLGERYGMPLPAARLARFIDGREDVDAHGPREMPVWGERLESPEPEETARPTADRRVGAIIDYLGTLQGAPASSPPEPRP